MYGFGYINNIFFEGVTENIVLWSVECCSYKYKNKYMYVYTDIEGNILFDNLFFDFAILFSNRCAFVITDEYNPKIQNFVLDIERKQVITIPVKFKSIGNIVDNNIPVLDSKTKKWGSYVLDLKSGKWSHKIPFIWDKLAFSRNKKMYMVGLKKLVVIIQILIIRYIAIWFQTTISVFHIKDIELLFYLLRKHIHWICLKI